MKKMKEKGKLNINIMLCVFNGTSSLLNGWRIGQSGIISASDVRRGVGLFSAF